MKGTPPYRLYKTVVAGGKPECVSGRLNALYTGDISPDGTRVVLFALRQSDGGEVVSPGGVYVVDVCTAQATRIAENDKQIWFSGLWSPDGKGIAYAWRAIDRTGSVAGGPPTRLVVCDADGKNAKTILTADEQFYPVAWW